MILLLSLSACQTTKSNINAVATSGNIEVLRNTEGYKDTVSRNPTFIKQVVRIIKGLEGQIQKTIVRSNEDASK